MKYLLFFALSLCIISSAMVGDWQPYDISNLSHDRALKYILDTSLDLLIERNQNNFPSGSHWHLGKVYSIDKQVVNGLNFRVKASVSNSEGKQAYLTWIVNVKPWTNQYAILSWEIEDIPKDNISQDVPTIPTEIIKESSMWRFLGTTKDAKIIQDLKQALSQMNCPTETEITDVYLHFTQTTLGQEKHMTTFRTRRNGDIKIIEMTYKKPNKDSESEEIVLESSVTLDNTAKYEVIQEKAKLDILAEAIESYMRIIEPTTYSQVNPPFLGAYVTQTSGKNLYYLSTIIQGSDHLVSHYEIWLKSDKPLENLADSRDLELFSFIKLDISKEGKPQRENLAMLVGQSSEIDCGKIPSYFVCSLYPQCTNQAFIPEARCKKAE